MPENRVQKFSVEDIAIRYSNFAPKLFNFCLSLGMQPNSIMPSRAFCSDENQGYPIILIAKHFGTFPFNHGRVGGIVATDRHRPHAQHGKDVVIIQASHVGYNPENQQFGHYRRLQTQAQEMSADCGAICAVLEWYQREYDFACQQILLDRRGDEYRIIIDNQLLNLDREEGLFLHLDRIIASREAVASYATTQAFQASQVLVEQIGERWPAAKTAIKKLLYPDYFYFKRPVDDLLASGRLNQNLIDAMPDIISHSSPALVAAQVNTQIEFDRTFRTLIKDKSYRGKKLVFISGIHVDISPREGQLFPLTKFVPWAAFIQNEQGESYVLEQRELFEALDQQSANNPFKIDLTAAIHQMESEPEVMLHVKDEVPVS